MQILAILAVGLLFVSSSAAYGKKPLEPLTVGTAHFPPFRIVQDNKVTGVDADIVTNVFANIGYSINFDVKPWQRIYQDGMRGNLEVIFSFTRSKDREKYFYFSDPINTVKDVFFKRKSTWVSWKKMQDLNPFTVGLSQGYSYPKPFMDALEKKVFRKVDSVSGENPEKTQLLKLARGRIDLFICEASVCSYIIQQSPKELEDIEYYNRVIGDIRTFHVGFSKKSARSEQLMKSFNKELAKMRKSGQLKKLYKQYGVVHFDQNKGS